MTETLKSWRAPTHTRRTLTSRTRAPLAIRLLLVLAILVPVELGFYVGTLFFTWSKVFLIFLALPVALRLPSIKLYLYDWMFAAHVFWSATAFCLTLGFGAGLQAGGTYILEMLIVYMTVRVYSNNFEQLLGVVRFIFLFVVLATVCAIPEALTGKRFIHDFASSITGITYNFSDEKRLGLLRAASFFEHPILHGMFCSAMASLVWFTQAGIRRLIQIAIIAFGTFLSLSSAPILVFILQVGLIVIERVTRSIKRRVILMSVAAAFVIFVLEIATNRGAFGVLTMVTLDSVTAWYRKAEWDFGIDDILRHPFFGIDPATWTRPEWLSFSIDNHWMLVAMRSGIPSLLFLLASIYLILRKLLRPTNETRV